MEIINWSGRALRAKRHRLKELSDREEIHQTGVYILTGPDLEDPGSLRVYVGEGDDIWKRIHSHDSSKDFWQEVTGFLSKDGNLTKAHVLYLEARLIEELREAGQCEIENATTPTQPNLPECDRSDMEYFLECIKLIMGLSGVALFASAATARPVRSDQVFFYRPKGNQGELVVTDKGYLVRKGSIAAARETPACTETIRRKRAALKEDGVLEVDGKRLRFTRAFLFTSPSTAGGVISGHSCQGPLLWKLPDGTPLREVLAAQGAEGSGGD